MNYLEKGSRGNIGYLVHQCAMFYDDPRETHAAAVGHIGRCLKAINDKGSILDPKATQSFFACVDADFSENWFKKTAINAATTAKSRTGCIITYAKCPILWASKVQNLATLSTTEAGYVTLSIAVGHAIVVMSLLKEIKIKDDSGALELARVPKMRPRINHINV
eukprot:14217620-Ditylum_brightwellii.AAC.1